jgi:hypothetical protein
MKILVRFGPLMLLLSTLNPQFSSVFAQGTLTPPGAPAATMKTLAQVEPRIIVNAANTPGNASNTFIISQAGSYYLTGNITGASGKHGISIQADDVTLDLNGFTINSGGGGTFRGVNVPAAQTNFCIRNGSVTGWTGGGVRAEQAVTLAEKLLVANNAGAPGLGVGNGSIIRDCVSSGNGTGFSALDRAQITNSIATVNTGNGFNCTAYVTLLDCTSNRNGGDGIVVQGSSSVIRCNASKNLPAGTGIVAGTGCIIIDCSAEANGGGGVSADVGSTIRNCQATANNLSGIEVMGDCLAIGNTCDQNNQQDTSGAGLSAIGTGNRIEANSCNSNAGANGDGFFIGGSNNLVIRNSARGNGTNYHFYINNRYGTIVDLTASSVDVPSANSGSSTLGTFDPWANFAY